MNKFNFALLLTILILLDSCNGNNVEQEYPKSLERRRDEQILDFKDPNKGIQLMGKRKRDSIGITVNSYLWRASLEAVANFPLQIVDPFSGVINTEWYNTPENKAERFKISIMITSDVLRVDGLKVNIFKQVMRKGNWSSAEPNKALAQDVEDKILNRARQLKVLDN